MTALPYTAIVQGEWFLYDRKSLRIQILGDDVDVSSMTALFKLLTEPGGVVVLTKDNNDIGHEGTTIISVPIGGVTDQELEDDYALIVSNFRSGVFFFQLYDVDTPILIAQGYATIGPAQNPKGG